MRTLSTRQRNARVLLCPGPVMLSPGVKAALTEREIGHRDTDFSQLMARLRRSSRQVFGAGDDHSIVFIGGPATAAIEATCATLLPAHARVLVPVNGCFGTRITEILKVHQIPHVPLDFGLGQPIDLERLESFIVAEQANGFTALAMTHHETSAGLLNPVSAVATLARRYNLRLIVDATSSAGVEDLDVSRDGIDACITTSGKCLHGPAGLGLVCVRGEFLQASRINSARSYTLDLHRYHDQLEYNQQTPFTPPVPLLLALERAIEELLERGIEDRRRSYWKRRTILTEGFARLGLSTLPLTAGSEASSILTVVVPQELGFDAFYAACKERGFLIYAAKPPLAPRYFQVAVMGALEDHQLYEFLECVESLTRAKPAHYVALPA